MSDIFAKPMTQQMFVKRAPITEDNDDDIQSRITIEKFFGGVWLLDLVQSNELGDLQEIEAQMIESNVLEGLFVAEWQDDTEYVDGFRSNIETGSYFWRLTP